MTREQVELVRRFFEPYGNQPGFGPALELVEHVAELQAFVLSVSEGLADPGVPVGHAVNRMQREAAALLVKIVPPKGAR